MGFCKLCAALVTWPPNNKTKHSRQTTVNGKKTIQNQMQNHLPNCEQNTYERKCLSWFIMHPYWICCKVLKYHKIFQRERHNFTSETQNLTVRSDVWRTAYSTVQKSYYYADHKCKSDHQNTIHRSNYYTTVYTYTQVKSSQSQKLLISLLSRYSQLPTHDICWRVAPCHIWHLWFHSGAARQAKTEARTKRQRCQVPTPDRHKTWHHYQRQTQGGTITRDKHKMAPLPETKKTGRRDQKQNGKFSH